MSMTKHRTRSKQVVRSVTLIHSVRHGRNYALDYMQTED